MKKILIKGTGVGGLTVAHELFSRGANITIAAPHNAPEDSASWYAGGMLSPCCKHKSAGQTVAGAGLETMHWWNKVLPGHITHHGTLVIAPVRNIAGLEQFAARTKGYEKVGTARLATLEPALAGHFRQGLFYADEAHLDPRRALKTLHSHLQDAGVPFTGIGEDESRYDIVIDATGRACLHKDKDLRGECGEMLLARTTEVSFSRPIRLLHPRIPLYIVPRADHIFMIGATVTESSKASPITARSIMEFLNAAYTVHPAFAEAEIIEIGVNIQPAYPDNLPRVTKKGNYIFINGFYRHGFLLAPLMAIKAAKLALGNETQ